MQDTHIQIVPVDGAPFRTVVHQGRTYIGGSLGQRYNIVVRNDTYGRLASVCTVDGRNVLDGKPGAYDGQAMIVPGSASTTFDGWRTSMSEVAAFRLADASESYVAKRGDGTSNVGVIGIALFKEKARDHFARNMRSLSDEPIMRGGTRGQSAGTGFGERHESRVSTTSFDRASEHPYAVHVIYYDTIDNLIARGILAATDGPNPFPAQAEMKFCEPV